MPRTCTICSHSERSAIDTALVTGTPYRNIGEQFKVSLGALTRHKTDHLKAELAAVQEERQAEALDHLTRLEGLLEKAEGFVTAAAAEGRYAAAASCIREARACLSLWKEWRPDPAPGISLTLLDSLIARGYDGPDGGRRDPTRLAGLLEDLETAVTGNAAAEAILENLAGVLLEALDNE